MLSIPIAIVTSLLLNAETTLLVGGAWLVTAVVAAVVLWFGKFINFHIFASSNTTFEYVHFWMVKFNLII